MELGKRFVSTLAAVLLLPVGAGQAAVSDVPTGGRLVRLRASQNNPERRNFTFHSALDAAVAPPFPSPATGASLLVFTSNAAGQCRAEIPLPASHWQAIRNDGSNRGWRYRDRTGSAGGIRRVVIRTGPDGGHIFVKGRGSAFPCALAAAAQNEPLAVVLRLGDTRYCAAFGGNVTDNTTGRFDAHDAPAPVACPDNDLTVANLNVLHGFFCPSGTGFCRLSDRIALLGQWIVERGCPDVVALQEVFDLPPTGSMIPEIQTQLLNVCPFTYNILYIRTNAIDDELLLSRYPALSTEVSLLYGAFRNVLYARLDHPIGPVDVFSTHLASGSDGANNPCGSQGPCPAECVAAGAATVRECQAVRLATFAEARHDVTTPGVIVGDFNAEPFTFVYNQFVDRGWPDTYLGAGNAECVPATGLGCTSGREDQDLSDLESPVLNQTERIDYVFLIPPGAGSSCAGTLDSPSDADGDGIATRLFADEPNPFASTCGPAPDPICWVSDHTGVQTDVNCD